MEKIRDFTDLHAWREAHRLVLMIYKNTETFPSKEMFGLTDQMRRAAISVTSNIVEGFSRNTAKDKVQFYTIAQGSLTELQNQLIAAKDIGYLTEANYKELFHQTIKANKLLNGLKKIRSAPMPDTRY